MTCRDVRRHLMAWARTGVGDRAEREAIWAHLRQCPSCEERARLWALKHVLLQATRADAADPAPSLYARVSAQLRQQRARAVFSFWEAVRAFSASVALVAMIVLILLVGVNIYVHQQIPSGRRDFISALMERNFSEAERLVFAGEEELNPDSVLSALVAESRESR
ncbi:hypothetical protein HRbin10_00418 [bacterium HR10]|nr:hypothetical protein HRbin10_00418 [bacterium HR10]